MSLKGKISDYVQSRKERRRTIGIPEFDEVIYFSPINILEWEEIMRLAKDSLALNNIYVVILKAEDINGDLIFSLDDRSILEKLDWKIIARIANEIQKETLKKEIENSGSFLA
jgi:hypothetical protein